ncbi:MAG TPA: glutathionylspermidine synthase family protein [Labilithrix sp.]|nr:glutathionylspermidine synthase family protein [Labilithrix sp.]
MNGGLVAVEPLPIAEPLGLPALERELVHEWLVWDAWIGGRRRVDLHPIVLTAATHREAVTVAQRAWALVSAAALRASSDAAERTHYRLHPDIERLAAAARSGGDLGIVARVDLLLREDGRFVACEVNADCPGGYNEAVALPRLARAAGLRRKHNPTDIAGRLADHLVERSGGPGSPRGIIALAYATAYAEDLQVCALLERLVTQRGGRAVRVPPTALAPSALGAGVTFRGERVSVLYRFYPLEWMAGQRNVDALARATAAGQLTSMSSFACIHAQSKVAMARAFVHDPVGAAEVFPETALFADVGGDRLVSERREWVVKRDLSRVGDHVFVGALATAEAFREIVAEIADTESAEEEEARGERRSWVAQRFVPQATLSTPWGPRLVTLGVYLLDGAFCGYFARLTPTSHCSHDALVLPVFVSDEEVVN